MGWGGAQSTVRLVKVKLELERESFFKHCLTNPNLHQAEKSLFVETNDALNSLICLPLQR